MNDEIKEKMYKVVDEYRYAFEESIPQLKSTSKKLSEIGIKSLADFDKEIILIHNKKSTKSRNERNFLIKIYNKRK